MPALSGARQRAKSVVCLSNLRQMVIAANMYVADNDGYYPLAGFMDFSALYCTWEWDFFKTFSGGVMDKCEPGFLWQGNTIPEIQQCPSFKGSANSAGDPYTGYNYNASYIGGFITNVMGTLRGNNSSKAVQVQRPRECAIFGDGQFEMGANKYMRSPTAGRLDEDFGDLYRYAGTQGYRHQGCTNVGYCDGSARSVRQVYTQTQSSQRIEEHNRNNEIKVGFLSADNSAYDLK
jgi:prepilin-type processing-associated H-X9-DG protein